MRRPGVPAEDVEQVLRLHADRVHDAVRRLGVGADAAPEVVRSTALALVAAVAERPQQVRDAVGWWFAAARRTSRRLVPPRPDLPLGGGVLASDGDQTVLAEAVEGLREDERLAVLTRDAYRLPWPSVAGALSTDETTAAATVFRARAHAVPLLDDEPAPPLPGHAEDLAGLARLADGDQAAPNDATLRRHVQVCPDCTAVVAAQERVRLLLSGLAVVALPDRTRAAVLRDGASRARAALPPAVALTLTAEERELWEDDERRVLPPVFAALGVLAAVILGTGLGVIMSRGASAVLPASNAAIPAVSLPPVAAPTPIRLPPQPPPAPVTGPRTTVTYLTPSPTPTTAPPTPSPTPTPSARAAVTVEPAAGPSGTVLRVTGTGWQPGGRVTVQYLDTSGRPTSSRATGSVAADGTFSVQLRTPLAQPGQHVVRATDVDGRTADGAFTATS